MKASVLSLAVLCSLPALQGCSVTPPPSAAGPRIEPLLQVSGAQDTAAGLLQLGRFYQAQNRLTQAEEAYRKALALNVDFVEVRSALGTLYARQGKYDEAIVEYTEVLRTAPQLAQIYNNLGYTYFLQGKHEAAVEALRKATALDPNNPRAFNNLAAAYEKLGRADDARSTYQHAQELHAGNAHRDIRPPAVAAGGGNDNGTASGNASTVLPAVAAGPVVDISLPPPAPAPVIAVLPPLPVAPPEKTAPARSFRFEIANGNGVAGLARRFRTALLAFDLPRPSLTNLKPYREKRTVIEYRPGYREDAVRLQAHLDIDTAALLERVQRQGTDVRLIIGHDIAQASRKSVPVLAKAGAD
ncbi:LytR C-terminal domain-containing protein [Noviherbaspirillum denitrificans]|uniref:LytR/CpsA/Psr regulator C-terminal domain-containing protein n=1 Tax=Noviherbaspirillum denitrificans TaxID=1968433 RepID=A0A254T944_9BURK|nr:LytR C-terminal domain-containing protein [Noviherbaspirillum denitrificans]OWW19095.1 hypothetical protein AYR66_05925 [Noviherbaspirillum denitrificans]